MNAQALLRPAPGTIAEVKTRLAERLGARVSAAQAVLNQHSHGEGLPAIGVPDLVVFPETNEEVAFILALCNECRVPVTPFGAGSSLEGQLAALAGGVSLDMGRFDKILDVSPDALDCRVQAGVTREALNAHVRDTGLFFPVDPGANASIGGMASTRASGTNAVRYGTMRENILGLTVVTPDGRIVRTGSRARKSSAGLDLTHLYVGSEGTLGVITEVQLKLYGLPETIVAAVCQFNSLEGAVAAVVAALQSNLRMARIELLDEVQMRAAIRYSKLDYVETPTLFLEFHGTPAGVQEEVEMMQAITADHGGGEFQFAERPEDRNRLWKARHNSYQAVMALSPGKNNMGTDACVPISALPACLLETKADIVASGLTAPIVGHVGDGNFHLGILFDPNDADETERTEALAFRTSRRAISMGGTCSGEHGVGVHKIVHMQTEHGEGVALMKAIKRALDPNGIMNPGKIYPLID
ncbi:FAD-binding oxidoreductase [Bradyrhizobium arachidis]|uniref:D-lactate dehydrogenase (cytochrome) n=1 Tax=Bradyrhizobium arachidis TaxID=858423 RepID=A0AAE7TJF7_9BRAD|nr:FAD-linked oxidase C-terminal domain-containing protein [Bradyrhizobium arachidis]QOZ71018.1 FAD-binding protein [Bradyrhizobium arachidis]SFV17778.1 D-lactate dehydrogenase (cytochrome) [Bradyrhizobium arachidis]